MFTGRAHPVEPSAAEAGAMEQIINETDPQQPRGPPREQPRSIRPRPTTKPIQRIEADKALSDYFNTINKDIKQAPSYSLKGAPKSSPVFDIIGAPKPRRGRASKKPKSAMESLLFG
jgi:hypothetical protein